MRLKFINPKPYRIRTANRLVPECSCLPKTVFASYDNFMSLLLDLYPLRSPCVNLLRSRFEIWNVGTIRVGSRFFFMWKFPWSSGLTKCSLMLLHQEVWFQFAEMAELCKLRGRKGLQKICSMAQWVSSSVDPVGRLRWCSHAWTLIRQVELSAIESFVIFLIVVIA